jgi:hypothetical protein
MTTAYTPLWTAPPGSDKTGDVVPLSNPTLAQASAVPQDIAPVHALPASDPSVNHEWVPFIFGLGPK